jgi:hypothetical protein
VLPVLPLPVSPGYGSPAPPAPIVTGYGPVETGTFVKTLIPPAPPPPAMLCPPPPPPATTITSTLVPISPVPKELMTKAPDEVKV